MFAVSASRTMKNARPKFREDDVVVRDIVQLRAEKKHEAERQRKAAQAAMDDIIGKYRTREWLGRVTPRRVIENIAKEHGVSLGLIIGQRRAKEIVAIRDKAVRAVAEQFPEMSLPDIGKAFKRDHTTIIHSLRKTKPEGARR